MRAARLVRHGAPLVVEDVELAQPGPDERVVELHYGGVNPVDRYLAAGTVGADGPLPRTLGTEAAGTVDGRPVVVHGGGLGTTRDGLWAEAAVVPQDALVAVPPGVGLDVAAAMGVAGVTAWRAVTELAGVGPGDRVLVLGASGGVGSIAVSIAAGLGATVWGQTSDPDKAAWIGRGGRCHPVLAGASGLVEAVRPLAPTVVLDPLGAGFTGAAVEALEPHGRLVLFGTSAGPTGEVPLRELYRKDLTVRGYGGLIAPPAELRGALEAALDALAAGRFEVPVGAVVGLGDVGSALDLLAGRAVCGKVVLELRGS